MTDFSEQAVIELQDVNANLVMLIGTLQSLDESLRILAGRRDDLS